MNFINSGTGYALFEYEANKKTYIDKTLMIDALYRHSQEINKYICVTKPRRFGKSTAANMIAAFFDKSTADESGKLFEKLNIGTLKEEQEKAAESGAGHSLCWPQQGKHNVIRINIIDLIAPEVRSYSDFYNTLKRQVQADITELYPELRIDKNMLIPEILANTGDSFVFVIDEWDAVFEMPFMTDSDKREYILFLKALLKDKKYVYFAYMTGILPIAKYSSGSPLNMFKEFTSFQDAIFYPYFGITEDEIRNLMEMKGYTKPTIEELSFWYDGYIRGYDGVHVYNPASVCEAMAEGICQSHWTGTGPMNEVRDIIRNNVKDLRQDIIRMAGGETLEIELGGFSVEKSEINTRDEILSAMVVYGFLTYYEGNLRIPNHELMLKFRQALASEQLGLNQTLEESKKLFNATLERDHGEVARLLEELHDEKIPFFVYNDENSLACVVTVGYLFALNKYRITRESKAGKGYVDFLFEPMRKDETALILELKYNHSAENALKSIHERDYIKRLKGYKRVLLVGINYSEAKKKHTCLTELVER